ncbi:hypothetical protein JW872_02435 [Candidatus Babeliales bacterium]|nr:hypothetical protein [Candidatus Babeliales bacterium]
MKRLLCLGLFVACVNAAYADCDNDGCCAVNCTSCSSTTTCNGARGCAEGVDACARPDFLPFSQGENRARDYAGQAHLQNLIDRDDWNWALSAAFAYNQNFDKERLGKHLSPSCCNNCFTVGPDNTSGVHVRGEDLGLSPTFRATLCLRPEIKNFVFEPSFYLGLDRWVEGMYLWFKIPVNYTNWDLEICETSSQAGGTNFLENLMDVGNDPVRVQAKSIKQAFAGTVTWGDKDLALQAGRIPSCGDSKTGVADIPVHLGWNFLTRDKGYLGLYLRTVFPTGTKEVRQSIFDPRVGYRRWQLGGGVQGRLELYNKDDETSLNAFTDLYVTHIFKNDECRLFDKLNNGTWSRYLLLKEFDANLAYTGRLRNFADIFNVCIKSGFNWMVDFLFFLELKHEGWIGNLGYELKARACEDFDCECLKICDPAYGDDCEDCSCTSTSTLRYGVKGTQLVSNTNIQPTATISDASTGNHAAAAATATNTFGTADTLTSIVDVESGRRPRMLSHKIYGTFGYTWEDRDYPIYSNLGVEVEFGDKNKALRQWGVWGKLGVSYN